MTNLKDENYEALAEINRLYVDERRVTAEADEEAKELIEARTHAHRRAVAEAIIAARKTSIPTPYARIREALGSTNHEVIRRYVSKEELP